jgi:dTDP-4-dehydrorhamnose 3,5-epimerase
VKLIRTAIPEVLLLEPREFKDARGTTLESYNRRTFRELTGLDVEFVQDNRSRSLKNVLRGLHYQVVRPQGKLITALHGEIYDIAVDLRRSSPTFKKWVGFELSAANHQMAWIPPGFGHGLLVLSDSADVLYKLSDFWSLEHERTILWNDPELAIRWPLQGDTIVSDKDRRGAAFGSADLFD